MPQGSNPSWVSRDQLDRIALRCSVETPATPGPRRPPDDDSDRHHHSVRRRAADRVPTPTGHAATPSSCCTERTCRLTARSASRGGCRPTLRCWCRPGPATGARRSPPGRRSPSSASGWPRLCRRLELRSITVVGISMGARSALTLAAQHPQLVSRVVLISPVSFAPWPDPRPAPDRLGHVQSGHPGCGLGPAARPAAQPTRRHPADRGARPDHGCRRTRRFGGWAATSTSWCGSWPVAGRIAGFVTDLRPPVDVTADVGQPTLVLATRNDASVSFRPSGAAGSRCPPGPAGRDRQPEPSALARRRLAACPDGDGGLSRLIPSDAIHQPLRPVP